MMDKPTNNNSKAKTDMPDPFKNLVNQIAPYPKKSNILGNASLVLSSINLLAAFISLIDIIHVSSASVLYVGIVGLILGFMQRSQQANTRTHLGIIFSFIGILMSYPIYAATGAFL